MNLEGCSCHINPPCSYCVENTACARCEAVTPNEDLDDDGVCGLCLSAERDQAERWAALSDAEKDAEIRKAAR